MEDELRRASFGWSSQVGEFMDPSGPSFGRDHFPAEVAVRCSSSVLARLQPGGSGALLLAVPTGTWRNRKQGRRLTSTSRLTPMWPHPCSVSSNVTSHVSVRAIGRL